MVFGAETAPSLRKTSGFPPLSLRVNDKENCGTPPLDK